MLPFAQRTLQGNVGLTVLSAPTLTVHRESPPFGTLRRGKAAARAAAAALRNFNLCACTAARCPARMRLRTVCAAQHANRETPKTRERAPWHRPLLGPTINHAWHVATWQERVPSHRVHNRYRDGIVAHSLCNSCAQSMRSVISYRVIYGKVRLSVPA